MSDVKLYLGDCLEILPTLAADGVDAVITDPPYGIDYILNWQKNNGFDRFEDMIQDFDPMPLLIYPVVVLFGANHYSDKLPLGGWYCWDKRLSKNADRMFGSSFELAWYKSDRTDVKMIRILHGGLINANGGKRVHPTEKPIELWRHIIYDQTNVGDTILDPFMGSGTTGVACVQTGRNFIGIEIEPKYFEIAEKRIKEAQLQLRLGI